MKNHIMVLMILTGSFLLAGCSGYSDKPLYSQSVKSICVEMFDNATFRRDLEYDLTDALAKKIESETPYKIVSNKSAADTVISGKITAISESTLTLERSTGRPLEKQAEVVAVFSWKNLKTGDFILENKQASASATYSEFQKQSFGYASKIAANRLAQAIV